MICASCLRQVDAGTKRCPACASDPLLDGRYRLDRPTEPAGTSYRATRVEDGRLVWAQPLSVDSPSAAADLEREIGREFELAHPSLPRGLELLRLGDEAQVVWRIHERIRGRSLAQLAAAEPELVRDPAWLRRMLHQVGEVLTLLHRQSPALVHGGIGPDTILVHESSSGSATRTERFMLLNLGLGIAPAAAPADDLRALGELALGLLETAPASSIGDSRLRAQVEALSRGELPPADEPEPKPKPPRFMMIEPMPDRPRKRPPRPARSDSPSSSKRRRKASRRAHERGSDIPVMRPDELSRELSQAYRATAALEQRQRKQLVYARVLVVLLTAIIAALATYLFMQS